MAGVERTWVEACRPDALLQATGLSGTGKATVSTLCKDVDDGVHAFLEGLPAIDSRHRWLDATHLKQGESEPTVTVAAAIAVPANTEGTREIVSLHTGPSEAGTF